MIHKRDQFIYNITERKCETVDDLVGRLILIVAIILIGFPVAGVIFVAAFFAAPEIAFFVTLLGIIGYIVWVVISVGRDILS